MARSTGSSLILGFSSTLVVGVLVCVLAGCTPAEAEDPARSVQPTNETAAPPDSFDVRLIDDENEGVFRLRIGPVDIPEASQGGGHHHHGVLPEPKTVRFPKSVNLTGFNYRVIDGSGEELPTDILHHMNVIKPQYRELFLPISQRMLALGNETGAQSLPGFLFGHPIKEGTEVVVSAMLHNPVGPRLDDVTVEVELDYVEGNRPWPLWHIYPFQLDVQFPVGEKAFDLPPGPSEFSYEGSPALEGRIAAVGSHLHDYAESIRLDDVTSGEMIWEGYPVKDEAGSVTGVTVGRLYKEFGKKIYPDHVYRVTVRYNNPTPDTLQHGGMGVVAGAFVPSNVEAWPRADTSNDLYRLDRQHYLRKVSGTYEELLARMSGDSLATPRESHDAHEHHNH